MNPESPDYYLIGHCIDGRVVYPATGYLVLAWRTLVRSLGVAMDTTPVTFDDVTIHRATILPNMGEEYKPKDAVVLFYFCRVSTEWRHKKKMWPKMR